MVEDYRSSGKEGFVVNIDLEKAYDHVDWKFLDFVLEKRVRSQMEKLDFELP